MVSPILMYQHTGKTSRMARKVANTRVWISTLADTNDYRTTKVNLENMHVRDERYSLLLAQDYTPPRSHQIFVHSTQDTYIWTQFIDKNLRTYPNSKCPSFGGKLIFTALEQVPGLFSVARLESAILLHI